MTLQSAAEGKEARVGTVVVMLFGSNPLLEAWRPKEWLDICLPMGSNEYEDALSHSMSFSILFSAPVLLRREKRAKGWGSGSQSR